METATINKSNSLSEYDPVLAATELVDQFLLDLGTDRTTVPLTDVMNFALDFRNLFNLER